MRKKGTMWKLRVAVHGFGMAGKEWYARFPRKPVAKYKRNPVTRSPGRAVVKYPERNVARFLKKPATEFPRKTAETISAWLISISVISPEIDPAFFYYEKNGRLIGMLAVHADDALYAERTRFDQVINYDESSVSENKPDMYEMDHNKSTVGEDKPEV